MTPKSPKRTPQERTIRFVLYSIPYLLIAYVLSIGPLYWQVYDAYAEGSGGFLMWFYYPLCRLSEIPYFSHFFEWYLQFWV